MTKKDSRSVTESILVVVATGTVGSELVRQFAATGRRVKALIRDERKAASIAHLAVPVIGDLAVPTTLEQAFKGAERVFVLAPPVPELELLDRNAFDAAILPVPGVLSFSRTIARASLVLMSRTSRHTLPTSGAWPRLVSTGQYCARPGS
jgi:uncharacterized protein YbjT (DUF2867 family)